MGDTYLVVRTLRGFRCCWRLESDWQLIFFRGNPTSLALTEIFEPGWDMNDGLWCIVLRPGTRASWELRNDLRSSLQYT
jgi:hypothetical protein